MNHLRKRFLGSVIVLMLCITMFIGTTFAWFTDNVTSSGNIIKSGNLDIEMYWTDDLDRGTWYNVEDPEHNTIFGYDNWEPGYTEVRYIKIVNNGNLALNYDLTLTPQNSVGKLAEVINVYFANKEVEIQTREDLSKLGAIGLLSNVLDGGATASGTLLAANQSSPLHKSGEVVMTIAMNMITSAGNEYQDESVGDFTITALATQAPFEQDSFGSNYDANAEMPTILTSGKVSVNVTPDNGKVPTGGVLLSGEGISAFVPAGVAMEEGANKLTLSVTPLKNTTSDITVVNNEVLIPVDVHIEGVAEDNTVPIVIELGEVLPKYMNMGNYHLFHVEDGVTSQMTLVDDVSELTAHNTFTYDPLTGEVSVAMATFSEVTLVADTSKAWKGEADYDWYDASKTELTIANADQLHAFSQIVGGMTSEIEQDSFAGKTVKLLSDINLNHGNVVPETEKENATTTIFYPIGYNNNNEFVSSPETNRPASVEGDVESTVYSFSGVFDGDGHKIAYFYQNTWEMFGDYNNGYSGTPNYYKDAMGLFGYVVNGTVKNLTIDNFESDGEFTPTGVVAAYAVNSTFENIAITNSNPRVYNTGNGGIVGIGGNSSDTSDMTLTFTNITIDNSNTISALWGSWDVACGGVMGMFRGNSSVTFTNCHVAAQIDVYNDVCGNYQYYWYRYSGMMIGSLRGRNTTDDEGYTVPDLTGIVAEGCTVRFDEWNDYYYCELVANSIASYTHDHQFSRLQEVAEVDVDNMKYKPIGATELQDIPTSGKYNFVVVTDKITPSTAEAECYHFVDGAVWKHADAGYEDFDLDGNGKLDDYKEDNEHIYLPFNQVFQGDGWGVKHIPISAEEGTNLNENEKYKDLDIKVLARQGDSVEKFIKKFDDDFLYRVGNINTVSLGDLFEATSAQDNKGNLIEINDASVWVTVEKFNDEMNVSGTVTTNSSDWTKSTIQFSGTGIVKITIQDYNYCTPTVLIVEVVDAVNATTATSATANNVVLLKDVSGSFSVSGNNTFYGNGFTVTLPTSSVTNKGNGFCGYVNLNNGHLDNVKINGPVYPEQYIYRTQAEITDSSDSDYGGGYNMRYFHNSVIVNAGDCNITNSYISGSRAAIYIKDGGDVLIEDTTVSGGVYANIEVSVADSVTFKNLTTEQKEVEDSYNQEKNMIGLGIVIDNAETDIYVEGTLNQYNWITQAQWESLLGDYAKQFPALFTDSTYESYWHYREGDSITKYVNLTMIFACDWDSSRLHENHSNKDDYNKLDVTVVSMDGGVYSTVGLGTLTGGLYSAPQYESTTHYAVSPKPNFDYTTKNYVASTEGSNEFCYEDSGIVKISFDEGNNKIWDTSILTVTKSTYTLPYTVSMNDTDYTGKSITFTTSGNYEVVYKYTDPYNYKLNSDGDIVKYSKEYQQIVNISVTAVKETAKNAEFTMGSNGQAVNKIIIDNNVYLSASGLDNSSWTSGTGLKFPQSDGDTSTISFKYSGTTNGSWASATINGQTFYFPVVAMGTTDSKFEHTGSWYGCFPVFEGAVTITDYADGGTGTKDIYNSSTTTMPEKLTALYPQTVFRYQGTQSKVPTEASKMTKGSYSGKLCYTTQTDLSASNERSEEWNLATYTYQDNKGTTYYWYVAYYCAASTNGGCVTPDTLITLADGSQVRIDELSGNEQLLVWNHTTGTFEAIPVAYIVNHDKEVREQDIIHLYFGDDSEVKIIGEHVFYDATLNKYVAITKENAHEYIGHKFVSINDENDDLKYVELVKVEQYKEVSSAYEVVSYQHLTCFTNGILSTSAYLDKLLNIFDINPDTMTYTAESVQKDIETHGLYTYTDFEGLISEEAFDLYNAKYLKIAVGKGYITWEDILDLIDIYFNVDVKPI